jgi:hypothetical protein
MASDRKTLLSEEQYLEIERKSEFQDGDGGGELRLTTSCFGT